MKSPNAFCTVPKLYTAGGDVNKKWFVYFHYFNPATGRNQRVRLFAGFADKETYHQKIQHGQWLVQQTTDKLKSGWCPFESEPALAVPPNHAGEVLEKGKSISVAVTQLLQRLNKELQWREKTFADYTSMAKIFSEYLSARKPHLHLRAFNEKEAQLFLQWLSEKRGPTTRNKYRAGLCRIWLQLVRSGHAIQNPWREIPKLREHRAGKLAFNEAQARALKQAMQKNDPWLWLVCSFQFHCFLRPVSEVRLIKIQDLDFDAMKVRIPAKNVKTHQSKILDMPTALCHELKEMQVHKLKPEYYLFGKNGLPGIEPISKNRFYKRHSKIQKAAGISSDFSLYSWKHTGNVMLYRKFKDLKMNQAINHHSDISTTDIYLRTKGAYNVEQVRTGFPTI
jgi:integrase